MNGKQQIAARLREEALAKYGSIKALAGAVRKTQQYLNIYLSGINAPGPKVRRLLEKAGLDVAYIMMGRRESDVGIDMEIAQKIYRLMDEKAIKTVEELRERLERGEKIERVLGHEVYETFLEVAVVREKQRKYETKKKKSR